jgi:hypothetical protein
MHIDIQATPDTNLEEQTKTSEGKQWYAFLLSPLWLCLLLALAVRIFLIIRSQNFLDGDEALIGIQAQRILHGELPIYDYGQPYMGSLEAYLMAIPVALFGASAWVLRIETALLALILVWLTWMLAGHMADAAKLSRSSRRIFMVLATLFAALPPLYDTIVEIHTWGGYIETFVIMLILLLAAFRLTRRWLLAETTYRELLWRWAGIGFTAGLGLWVDPLVLSAVLAAGLWIIGGAILILYRNFRENQRSLATLFKPHKIFLTAIITLPAALLGFTPGIIWGIQNHWENITYIFNIGGGGGTQQLHSVVKIAKVYLNCLGPRMISGSIPGESTSGSMPFLFLLIVGIGCIFGSIMLLSFSINRKYTLPTQARNLVALPLLFGICTAVSFCLGKTAIYATISCSYDPVGRYATPLLLALPFFYATVFTLLFQFLHQRRTPQVPQSTTTATTSSSSPHLYTRIAQSILFVLLLCCLVLQAFTYQQSNIAYALQSPYCHQEPINYTPIIHYLESEHIHYAWSDNWIAYPIIFETNGQIVITDAEAFFSPPLTYDRIPSNTVAVRHADRPSLLVLVWKNDPHPPLLQELNALGVTYKSARFPAVPDTDVLIVTPLNRTVSPFASKAIASNFGSCNE